MTYVHRINLAVELVDTDILGCAPPMLAVLPHESGLFEIEVACTEEAAVCAYE